jgi:hypothetical protein
MAQRDPTRERPPTPAPDPASERAATAPDDRLPHWVRPLVAAYLIAFAVCGVFAIEAWPLTGWRLFSQVRRPVRLAWQAVTVDRRGAETPISFHVLPRAYRHLVLIMQVYPKYTPARQEAVCEAWAAAMRGRGRQVSGVRIYRLRYDLRRHIHRTHAPAPKRHVRYLCADGKGARVAA